MNKRVLGLCLTILTLAISVCAQTRVDEHGMVQVTEEQMAANKRLGELLRHPTFVTLRLVSSPRDFPPEGSSDAPSPYTVNDWISFQLLVTQSLSETLIFESGLSLYYEYRPEPYKDGDILPFSKEVAERVNQSDRRPWSISAKVHTLNPGREYEWATVNLDDWYERLGPGHYQLSVRKRFAWDGDWVQSNSVTFDVQPRKPPIPIPAGVTVEMVPQDFQLKPKQKLYRLSGEGYVTVIVVNNSDRQIPASVVDIYYGNRPQLFKDGVLLPYQNEMVKLLNSKEENSQLVAIGRREVGCI